MKQSKILIVFIATLSIFAFTNIVNAGQVLSSTLPQYVVNVKEAPYNATGDGVTDDTAAIQAALTAGAGKHVFFPDGTYKITAYLSIATGTLVTGAGRGSKLMASSVSLNDLPSPDGPGASAVVYVAQNAANVVIRDLFVAGAYTGTGAGSTTFGIYLGTGTSNCTVESVWLEDHSWSGLLVHGTGHLIRGNHTKHNAIDGIEISNANNISVIGNYSDSDAASTVTPGVAGIEVAVTTTSTGIVLANNIIKSSGGHGIFTSPGAGDSLTDLTITGNTIITPTLKGISVAVLGATQTDVLIADNIVDTPAGSGSAGHGIYLFDVTRFTVIGNSVRGATTGSGPSGLKIDGASTRGTVAGNILTGNWVGLDIAGTANNIALLTNHIYGNTGTDLSITTSGAGVGVSGANVSTVDVLPTGTGAGNTGELRFLELAANGTNYVAIKAPDAVALTSPYTLGEHITPGSGTGITLNEAGSLQRSVYKVTATFAAFSCAALTCDKTIATLPAKTRLVGIISDATINFTGGAVTATNLMLGKSVGGSEYMNDHSVFSGTPVKGLLDSDLGTVMNRAGAVQGGDLPSWTATTAVSARITTVTANTDVLTAGSVTVYLITEKMP